MIRSMPHANLITLIKELGEPAYKAGILKTHLYKHGATSFEEVTSLSKETRARLSDRFDAALPKIEDRAEADDGTIKFLLRWSDVMAECVLMPSVKGKTLCISSQAGCRLKCAFCATGTLGLKRNLRFGEILDQVLIAGGEGAIHRIVVMGMGEPMENLAELLPAIEFLKDKTTYGISRKKITVSTVGLCPELREFAESGADVELAFSLHATDNRIRDALVPVNRKYPIAEALEAAAYYGKKANARVTIEYILLDDMNDTDDDAKRLAKFARKYEFPVNLIIYNEIEASTFGPSKRLDRFVEILATEKAVATVRRSKGARIAAACGQLAAKIQKGTDPYSRL